MRYKYQHMLHIEAKEKTLRFQRSLGNCKNVAVISSVSLSPSISLSLSLPLLPSSPIGQPRHSHQWAAEALTSVGSRGTLISGQPRHSHLSQAILPQRGIAILGACVRVWLGSKVSTSMSVDACWHFMVPQDSPEALLPFPHEPMNGPI